MGLFDPKVDANIAPTQQVSAGPSGLQVLGSLVGGAIDAYGAGMKVAASSAPTSADKRSAIEDAQFVGLSNSLLKVEALRRDGRIAEADRAEQVVLANAARDGVDLSSGQTKALFRATTGRDPAHMGMSQEEVVTEQLMKSPEFQNNYIASYASGSDMSPEERKNFALAQIARQQGHALVMQNTKIDWAEGREEAFGGVISSFQQTNLGSLTLAATEGKMIPLGTIDQTQAAWEATKSQLVGARPTGLSDAEWKKTQERIDGVDATFTFLRSISTGDAIDGRIAQAASAAISQMDISDVQKQMLTKTIKDPNAFLQFNVVSASDMKDLMEAASVSSFDKGEFGLISDPNVDTGVDANGEPKLFPDSVMMDIEGMDPAELLKQAGNITKSINMGGTATLVQDADQRDAVVSTLSKAFAAMTTISKDNKEFVSGAKVNEVFDGTIISAIDEVAKVNPAQARTLLRQGEEALNQQDAVATAALQNLIGRSAGFGYENGKVVMNAEAMENLGFDQGIQDKFTLAADKYYAGDLAAMFADQGRRINPTDLETKQARDLARGGMVAGLNAGIKQLNDMAATVNTIRNKRNEFRTRADGLTPQPEAASEDTQALVAGTSLGNIEATTIRGFDKVAEDTPFLNEVAKVGNRLGINPTDLLAAISFETIGSFNPSIKNPNGSATGLIQFLESTAEGLGTSTKDLAGMSRVEQMAYVEQYLKPYKGRMKNLGDVYMAIHWPAAIGKANDYVMYESGSDEYASNQNLDVNGDGTVTRGETLTRLDSVFKGGPTLSGSGSVATTADAQTEAPTQPSAPTTQSQNDLVEVAIAEAGAYRLKNVNADEEAGDTLRERNPSRVDAPSEEAVGRSVSRQLDAAAIAKLVDDKLTAKQKRQIRAAGYRPEETEFFETQEEAEAALAAGEVDAGTLYVDGLGNVWLLE